MSVSHIAHVVRGTHLGDDDMINGNDTHAISDIELTIHQSVHVGIGEMLLFTVSKGGKQGENADPISFCRTSSARRFRVHTSV